MNVSAATVGGFAVAVVYNCDVADPARRWAVAQAGAPAVGVDAAGKDWRAIADRVETVQVRIVIGTAVIIVIAVGVRVISPLGTAGADVDRAGVAAAPAIIAGTGAVGRAHRGEVRVVVAGCDCGGGGQD